MTTGKPSLGNNSVTSVDICSPPSLSVATLPRKALLLGFGTHLLLARYACNDEDPEKAFGSVLIEEGQEVRAVSFMRVADGPLCIVSAGDDKLIKVYNLTSWKEDHPEEGAAKKRNPVGMAEKWVPSFHYGPHTKRITNIAACNDGTIVFADKFGEVYQLCLSWSPSHTLEVCGDASKPATFVLQHFSSMSSLFLSSPIPRFESPLIAEGNLSTACRRLFTADKDCHTRVSTFPGAHTIEQFLWSKTPPQAVVTCIAEIPFHPSGNIEHEAFESRSPPPYSYYATGDYHGRVHFWAARNDVLQDAHSDSIHLISVFNPHRSTSGEGNLQENLGPVVSIVHVAASEDVDGSVRHPKDVPRGVLVAYAMSNDIVFLPFRDCCGTYGLRVTQVNMTRTTLHSLPVAMTLSNESTAFVLERDGSFEFLRLSIATDIEECRVCAFSDTIRVAVMPVKVEMPGLKEMICTAMLQPARGVSADGKNAEQSTKSNEAKGLSQPAATCATQLAALDLFSQWRSHAVDPRTRRNAHKDENDDDGDGDDDSSDNTAPEEALKKKKHKRE